MNAVYARQSMDRPDSLSIETQVESCLRLAGPDAAVYRDRGYSGKNVNRPDFTRLLDDVRAGRIAAVYVYRLDRFSRSIADFSRLWELLDRCGVGFCSVTENFDTSTPMGRAMLHIVLVFAQLERETTAARVRDNYTHRVALGRWPGGPAPYGFRLVKTSDKGKPFTALEPNDRADVVRRLYRDYVRPGASLRSLAAALTAEGVPGPSRKAWDSVTLSRLLHSPLYVRADQEVFWYFAASGARLLSAADAFDGVHACNLIGKRDRTANKYRPAEGRSVAMAAHEGLIDAGLWLRVQDKLDACAQVAQPGACRHSWLTGLLKCARCGYAVKIGKSRGRYCLSCSGRSNLGVCGASFRIDLHELERETERRIEALLEQCPPVAFEVRSNAGELLALDRRIMRLVAALEQGSAPAEYIAPRIRALEEQRRLLEQPVRTAAPTLRFPRLSAEEKHLVAAQLIRRILLEDDRAEIQWNI